MARKHFGGGGSGQRPEREQRQAGEPGKRYSMDCREADPDGNCTLVMSGSMEEVISTGEMHARKAHGMRGSEEEIRRQLRENVKEEGSRTEQRADMPPA